jgi:urease accessory protein
MTWYAKLELHFWQKSANPGQTVLDFRHDGPLRVLQTLYPEGPQVCHSVLVHPPGGLVGGDTLDIRIQVDRDAHALVSTPGATRFYKTDTDWATQRVHIQLAPGARLEWLPLETLAYNGCKARNILQFELGEGAELMGWDITALGLPASGQAFSVGCLVQRVSWPGQWREHARVDASDLRLLNSPLGLNGHRCMGTFWLATGSPWSAAQRQSLLDEVRSVLPSGSVCAVTSPSAHLVVTRCLGDMAEPVRACLQAAWAACRRESWRMGATPPRIWQV